LRKLRFWAQIKPITRSGTGIKSVEDTLVQIEHDWGNALLKGDIASVL